MRGKWRAQRADRGAHAARGFVGGAARYVNCTPHPVNLFQCRTRLCGWCSHSLHALRTVGSCFNAARGFVGGAANQPTRGNHRKPWFQCRTRLCGWCNICRVLCLCGSMLFQCRTRLCGWCNKGMVVYLCPPRKVSMPHAALWVVQLCWNFRICQFFIVSMPHAALWVVQPHRSQPLSP